MDQLRKEREERLEWLERENARKLKEKEKQVEEEYRRRMNPQTKEDFALLYSALESTFYTRTRFHQAMRECTRSFEDWGLFRKSWITELAG